MLKGMLGKKIGMSRWFDSEGNSIGVSLIKCGPCYIVDKKDNKIQIGFEEIKESRLNKSQAGYLKKKKLPSLKYLKEVGCLGKSEQIAVGDRVLADIFKVGEFLDIQGISKGKGFSGVVKRWGFRGAPASHGAQGHRVCGSVGASSDPSRVWPGLRMPGRKGSATTTVFKLKIMEISTDENLIIVKGAVPGPKKGLLFLKRSVKKL